MLSILFSILFSVSSAQASIPNAKMPVCMDDREELQIDNERVLEMKRTTRNQFQARAFVEGAVTVEPYMKNGHEHFAIAIGPRKDDTIEIIYNIEFGDMPRRSIRKGEIIQVCGDYITSTGRSRGYDPSPEGALIHWVHYNPANRQGSMNHEHGFIMFQDDELVGFDDAPASAWDGVIGKNRSRNNSSRYSRDFDEEAYDQLGRSDRSSRPQYDPYRRPASPSRRSSSGVCRSLSQCRGRI